MPYNHNINWGISAPINRSINEVDSAFSPADLSNIIMWLDASDTSPTNIVQSGGLVSQWSDKSGNDYHVVQGNASLRPSTNVNTTPSGNNVITFTPSSGIGKFLENTSFTISQPNTIIVIGRRTVTFDGDFDGYFVDGNHGTNRNIISNRQTGDGFMYYAGTLVQGGTSIGSDYHIWEAEYNGASSEFFLDGVSQGVSNAGALSLTGITVGDRYVQLTNSGLTGDISQVIVVDGIIPESEKTSLYAWAASKM